jgi:hypothetical protein
VLQGRGDIPTDISPFSTNKTDCHDITEILLKVALHTINHNHKLLNQAAKVIQTDLCCSSCISEAASNGEISVGISPRKFTSREATFPLQKERP